MTSALRLLLAVQASLLLSGTLGAPGAVQAGRHLLAAAATPPSSIINTILAAGKGFNSFGQTTPQVPPAPASAFSLPTTVTTLPAGSGDADLLFACRALGVQIYTGGLSVSIMLRIAVVGALVLQTDVVMGLQIHKTLASTPRVGLTPTFGAVLAWPRLP